MGEPRTALALDIIRVSTESAPVETTHYVYILKCRDGTYYHGYTRDLKKRLLQHRSGESHPTRRKLPLELVYFETLPSKTEAMRRERQLKNGRTRKETKEKLIREFQEKSSFPSWNDVNP